MLFFETTLLQLLWPNYQLTAHTTRGSVAKVVSQIQVSEEVKFSCCMLFVLQLCTHLSKAGMLEFKYMGKLELQ